jgi:hypothetical protein
MNAKIILEVKEAISVSCIRPRGPEEDKGPNKKLQL